MNATIDSVRDKYVLGVHKGDGPLVGLTAQLKVKRVWWPSTCREMDRVAYKQPLHV